MQTVKLSSKNQIVVPREAREAIGVKSGEEIVVVVHGDQVLLVRRPKSYTQAMLGIGKGLTPKNYLRNERRSWT
jgi:AbrB family looped-hinge helix DNA binding protein